MLGGLFSVAFCCSWYWNWWKLYVVLLWLDKLLEISAENMSQLTILSNGRKDVVSDVKWAFPTAYLEHAYKVPKLDARSPSVEGCIGHHKYQFQRNNVPSQEVSLDVAKWIRRIFAISLGCSLFRRATFVYFCSNNEELINVFLKHGNFLLFKL